MYFLFRNVFQFSECTILSAQRPVEVLTQSTEPHYSGQRPSDKWRKWDEHATVSLATFTTVCEIKSQANLLPNPHNKTHVV